MSGPFHGYDPWSTLATAGYSIGSSVMLIHEASFPLGLLPTSSPAPSPYWLPWWLKQQRIFLKCGRPGFDPWVGKMPWRRKWQPTPVFLPEESHGQRNLVGYHPPWGSKALDTTEQLTLTSPYHPMRKEKTNTQKKLPTEESTF